MIFNSINRVSIVSKSQGVSIPLYSTLIRPDLEFSASSGLCIFRGCCQIGPVWRRAMQMARSLQNKPYDEERFRDCCTTRTWISAMAKGDMPLIMAGPLRQAANTLAAHQGALAPVSQHGRGRRKAREGWEEHGREGEQWGREGPTPSHCFLSLLCCLPRGKPPGSCSLCFLEIIAVTSSRHSDHFHWEPWIYKVAGL